MIVLENVCKSYQIGDETVWALNHASLHIEDGEFVSIVGPSGSGKSTLMNIIGCLDVADEGRYYLDGMSITQYSEDDLALVRNEKIGFVFQSFNLINNLTAWENVELPLVYQRISRKERMQRVNEAIKRVRLEERQNHRPMELSGGQQQRVAIARALATQPSMILADEPTGNLDSQTGEEIMSLFHELHDQGNTFVLITHDEGVAKQAERIIYIKDGRVQEAGRKIDKTDVQFNIKSAKYLLKEGVQVI